MSEYITKDEIERYGLKESANRIIMKARQRGCIATNELSLLLKPDTIRNREKFSQVMMWLHGFLQGLNLGIATGNQAIEVKEQQKKSRKEKKQENFINYDLLSNINESIKDSFIPGFSLKSTLSWYLSSSHTFLKPEEEIELSRQVIKENNLEARNKLVLHNIRFINFIAYRDRNIAIEIEDILQEGALGLITAADRFDYRKGNRFTTYAGWWIKSFINRFKQNHGKSIRKPVHVLDLENKMRKKLEELAYEKGRLPTCEEVIKYFDEKEKASRIMDRMGISLFSLDSKVDEGDSRSPSLQDYIKDERTIDAVSTIEVKQILESLVKEVNDVLNYIYVNCTYREYKIFHTFFGFDDPLRKRKTLEKTSNIFSLTRERIRQILEEKIWIFLKRDLNTSPEEFSENLFKIGELETLSETVIEFPLLEEMKNEEVYYDKSKIGSIKKKAVISSVATYYKINEEDFFLGDNINLLTQWPRDILIYLLVSDSSQSGSSISDLLKISKKKLNNSIQKIFKAIGRDESTQLAINKIRSLY